MTTDSNLINGLINLLLVLGVKWHGLIGQPFAVATAVLNCGENPMAGS
jgi:hypothetical protein